MPLVHNQGIKSNLFFMEITVVVSLSCTSDKSTKVKKKSAKVESKMVTKNEKIKLVKERSKLAMEIVKNPTINEKDKHGVGYTRLSQDEGKKDKRQKKHLNL